MHTIFKSALLSAFLATSSLAFAADIDTATNTNGSSLWTIGVTGVMCYTEPCPWRGIAPIGPDGQRGFPVNSSQTATDLFTSSDAIVAARIQSAFEHHHCLIVKAELVDGRLDVEQIVGDC